MTAVEFQLSNYATNHSFAHFLFASLFIFLTFPIVIRTRKAEIPFKLVWLLKLVQGGLGCDITNVEVFARFPGRTRVSQLAPEASGCTFSTGRNVGVSNESTIRIFE